MSDDRYLDLIPYSMRRRASVLNRKLPQDRDADEDLEAVSDETIRRDRAELPVNLGFASLKGRRNG